MAKAKSKAVVMAADGAGAMKRLEDRRFEAGPWPISFDLPEQQADNWFQYLAAECNRRGWNSCAISQIEAKENSGSLTITASEPLQELALVWERKRSGPMKVRSR